MLFFFTPSKKKLLSEWSIWGPATLACLRLSEGADEGFPTLKSSQSQTNQITQSLSFWVGGDRIPGTDGLGRKLGAMRLDLLITISAGETGSPVFQGTPRDKELPRIEHSDHWLLNVSFPGMVLQPGCVRWMLSVGGRKNLSQALLLIMGSSESGMVFPERNGNQ